MKVVLLIVCVALAGCGIGPWKKGRGTNYDPNDRWESTDYRGHKRL